MEPARKHPATVSSTPEITSYPSPSLVCPSGVSVGPALYKPVLGRPPLTFSQIGDPEAAKVLRSRGIDARSPRIVAAEFTLHLCAIRLDGPTVLR